MKKVFFIYLLLCIGLPNGFSQIHWDSLAGASNNPKNISVLYADSNYIYVAGGFYEVGGVPMNQIARWNGIKWDSMGSGVNSMPHTGGGVGPMINYHNKFYAGGVFWSMGNVPTIGIATWNGSTWDSMPITPFKYYDGPVVSAMAVIDNKLYIGGWFDTVARQPNVFDIACWNDTNWSGLNFPNLANFEWIEGICEYNGEIYAMGAFYGNTPNDTISNILRWNGSSWLSVGGGIKGLSTAENSMVVYNGELYIAGTFSPSDGNADNNIERWDGSAWHAVGGGTDYEIFDLIVYNNKLYAMGQFEHAGGVYASNIAEWNGTEWCSLGDTFDNALQSACVYKDSLYIGGGFWIIDNDTIGDIAEWTGGDYTDSCGNDATGVSEVKGESEKVKVYPNPSNGQFTFTFSTPINGTIEIYDITGQRVCQQTVQSEPTQINLTGQPTGMYFYRVITNTGSLVGEGKIAIEK